PAHELNEEEDAEDEDLNAPVELKIEFLTALMNRDFQLACKLCQMILIHEPDNPEASEFVPLLQRKLLESENPSSGYHEYVYLCNNSDRCIL
uniref:Glutamate-rich 2 n=1 Tax=Echeneis naucrates TaxID=173247 RepID=A0A665U1U2_ECHNA